MNFKSGSGSENLTSNGSIGVKGSGGKRRRMWRRRRRRRGGEGGSRQMLGGLGWVGEGHNGRGKGAGDFEGRSTALTTMQAAVRSSAGRHLFLGGCTVDKCGPAADRTGGMALAELHAGKPTQPPARPADRPVEGPAGRPAGGLDVGAGVPGQLSWRQRRAGAAKPSSSLWYPGRTSRTVAWHGRRWRWPPLAGQTPASSTSPSHLA